MTDSPKPQQGAYASCCVLSYERPQFLAAAIESLRENAGLPVELIVHDDGSTDPRVHALLDEFLRQGIISTLIRQPPGHNLGVGEAVRRMFAVASGEMLIKIDQDLVFNLGWLGAIYRAFYEADTSDDSPPLGALGAFRYWADPVDHAKMERRYWTQWVEVEDFVGSLIAVPRRLYERFGPFPTGSAAFAEDIEFKQRLVKAGYVLGLPAHDIAHNKGFGVGPSTVVTAPNTVREIHQRPVLHGA